jgi:putative membrane protein
VWGLSVTEDQQLAGAIMKTGGSMFLWTIIVWMWFKRFSASHRDEQNYKREQPTVPPGALADVPAGTLEYDDVERVFAETAPPHEPTTG